MKFTKMHGLGNDYIYVNLFEEGEDIDFSALSIYLSDRHFGIGADGIITIGSSSNADYFMQIYNADGSKGEMCGNGIRCVGKYVYDNHMTDKTNISVDTLAGIKYLKLNVVNDRVETVDVDMGIPTCHDGSSLSIDKVTHDLEIDGNLYRIMDISVGNPHAIIFVPEINDELVLGVGPKIEKHPWYPNRTNVEFVKILDKNILQMRVFERGSGETFACGTGATATAIAYMMGNNDVNEVIVKLLGGDLSIRWDRESNHVFMNGPATKVFDGEVDVNNYKLTLHNNKR